MDFTLIQKIAIWSIPVLFAIVVHEVAHGYVASKFGDQTARLSGRLTLNPFKHIDLIGTIIVPLLMLLVSNFIFGWAKPVPVDARNMQHPKRDMAIVSAAGPISNFLMAIFWGGIAKLATSLDLWFGVPLFYMGQAGMMVNAVLGILNCLPIPPLDGAKILSGVLPGRLVWQFNKLEPYGFFILIILMMSGGLSFILSPLVMMLLNGIAVLFRLN